MSIVWSSISRAGGRRTNEDYCSAASIGDSHIWTVADGMGGHHGGEVASQLAVESMLHYFSQKPEVNHENLQACLQFANHQMLTTQASQAHLSKMQTTVVTVMADRSNTAIAHLGDSRCYLFQHGKIIWQTKDHSVVQKLVNQGEIEEKEMRNHEDRNKVLKSLGKDQHMNPSIHLLNRPLAEGDGILLCTDGFWEYVLEAEMEVDYFKARTPEDWLKMMENRLRTRVEKNHDNYTAIAVIVDGHF
ncbi:protein phosphatase 2C domain-containing protein [Bacillus sp. 31A1R]|uniref:Protein phosphatase 2C domain-containing protein n=1 Tax=Robertmurraya mangrovi TaxID=3098077 RepID=A0ABU5J0X5_9BACI|nr:protein phosphatase 2C domain-containing protein [Bacillus sp. 31A1R]MDZ5473052.1 protein phosphatase 2C domain-containing protein [Bacillus sp. 31A1R]